MYIPHDCSVAPQPGRDSPKNKLTGAISQSPHKVLLSLKISPTLSTLEVDEEKHFKEEEICVENKPLLSILVN
uniref:Uncharacterized protein n=1 Tax=Cucumis melo TaxID=3656 RepID=A0A9I9EKY9_CUCME